MAATATPLTLEMRISDKVSAFMDRMRGKVKETASEVKTGSTRMRDEFGRFTKSVQDSSGAVEKTAGKVKSEVAGVAQAVSSSTKNVEQNTQKTKKGLDDTGKSMGSLGGVAGGLKSKIIGLLAVFGISLTATAFVSSLRETIDMLDNASKGAKRAGVDLTAMSRLNYAAELADVSPEKLQTGFKGLAKALQSGSDGFKQLGIDVRDANGAMKPSDQIMGEVLTKLGKVPDPMTRIQLAMELLGKGGMDMLTLVGSDFDQLRSEAERLGVVFDKDLGESAEEFNDSLTRMGMAGKGLKATFVSDMLPGMANFFNTLAFYIGDNRQNILDWVNSWKPAGSTVLETVRVILQAMGFLVAATIELGDKAQQLPARFQVTWYTIVLIVQKAEDLLRRLMFRMFSNFDLFLAELEADGKAIAGWVKSALDFVGDKWTVAMQGWKSKALELEIWLRTKLDSLVKWIVERIRDLAAGLSVIPQVGKDIEAKLNASAQSIEANWRSSFDGIIEAKKNVDKEIANTPEPQFKFVDYYDSASADKAAQKIKDRIAKTGSNVPIKSADFSATEKSLMEARARLSAAQAKDATSGIDSKAYQQYIVGIDEMIDNLKKFDAQAEASKKKANGVAGDADIIIAESEEILAARRKMEQDLRLLSVDGRQRRIEELKIQTENEIEEMRKQVEGKKQLEEEFATWREAKERELGEKIKEINGSVLDGMKGEFKRRMEEGTSTVQAGSNAMALAFNKADQAADAFTTGVTEGSPKMAEAFDKMAKDVIKQLINMIIKMLMFAAIGATIGFFVGGPAGAMAGAQLGASFGSGGLMPGPAGGLGSVTGAAGGAGGTAATDSARMAQNRGVMGTGTAMPSSKYDTMSGAGNASAGIDNRKTVVNHITITATDANSFNAQLRKSSRTIQETVQQGMDNNRGMRKAIDLTNM